MRAIVIGFAMVWVAIAPAGAGEFSDRVRQLEYDSEAQQFQIDVLRQQQARQAEASRKQAFDADMSRIMDDAAAARENEYRAKGRLMMFPLATPATR